MLQGLPHLVPDAAGWAARLRAAADEVQQAAASLHRRAGSTGLAGPAGRALDSLVADAVREARELAGTCAALADQISRRSTR